MLPPFDCSITVNPSSDLKKYETLIYLITGYLLLCTLFSVTIRCILLCGLFLCYQFLPRCRTSLTHATSILYQKKQWKIPPSQETYEKVRIAFDGGAFLVVSFENQQSKKSIYLMKDQLSKADLHLLKRAAHR